MADSGLGMGMISLRHTIAYILMGSGHLRQLLINMVRAAEKLEELGKLGKLGKLEGR